MEKARSELERVFFIGTPRPSPLSFDPLDYEAFEYAFNTIARRHEIWRTTYDTVEGHPVQIVSPFLTLQIPIHDLQDLPKETREVEAVRLIVQETQTPSTSNADRSCA